MYTAGRRNRSAGSLLSTFLCIRGPYGKGAPLQRAVISVPIGSRQTSDAPFSAPIALLAKAFPPPIARHYLAAIFPVLQPVRRARIVNISRRGVLRLSLCATTASATVTRELGVPNFLELKGHESRNEITWKTPAFQQTNEIAPACI